MELSAKYIADVYFWNSVCTQRWQAEGGGRSHCSACTFAGWDTNTDGATLFVFDVGLGALWDRPLLGFFFSYNLFVIKGEFQN